MAPVIVTVHVCCHLVSSSLQAHIFRPPAHNLVLPVISQRARLSTRAGYTKSEVSVYFYIAVIICTGTPMTRDLDPLFNGVGDGDGGSWHVSFTSLFQASELRADQGQ